MAYSVPGVYVEEIPGGARPISAVGTSTAGFLGRAPSKSAPVNRPIAVTNWTQFKQTFCGDETTPTHLVDGVYGYFQNGGTRCFVVNLDRKNDLRAGLEAMARVDEVATVVAPGYTDGDHYSALLAHCSDLKDRVAVLDAPETSKLPKNAAGQPDLSSLTRPATDAGAADGGEAPESGVRPNYDASGYGAFYFPWLRIKNPLDPTTTRDVPPSGFVAGIFARVDGLRGVHKAPANEVVRAAAGLTYFTSRLEQGPLNDAGVNVIRYFTNAGTLVWGARTIAESSSEFRYLNVRRLFNMVKESIEEGMRWVVFEPNDHSLWKTITTEVSNFLMILWRQGALMGQTPEEAFYVKCDAETNPPEVIDRGQLITEIGIAPVKPAEFIIFRIGQSLPGVGGGEAGTGASEGE